MASTVEYYVYGNTGNGGPIDYSTILATVNGTTWTTPQLQPGSSWLFAVRAFDPSTGYFEQNIDVVTDIVLDANGNDLSILPNAPIMLSVRANKNGTAVATWVYNPAGEYSSPSQFSVYMTAGNTINYANPISATVPYVDGTRYYSATLSGLSDSVSYSIGVRSTNALGTETNVTTVQVVGLANSPRDVDNLQVTMGGQS